MKYVPAKLGAWLVPLALVMLVAGAMVAISIWVLHAAYERDAEENVAMLQRRVEWRLGGIGPWASPPKEVFETLASEVLGDRRVQAVCVFDSSRPGPLRVRRDEAVPVPNGLDDIDAMVNADPRSMRRKLPWYFDLPRLRAAFSQSEKRQVSEDEVRQWLVSHGARPDLLRGYIYVDVARPTVREFLRESKPLLKRVGAFTGVTIIMVSALGIFAYRSIQKLARTKQNAELSRQGLLAERGLTAAVLAHEIRNPLAALRFQLHSLRRNADNAERTGKTADTIDAELSRIQQLVQDYLAHERAQSMRTEQVNLMDAARGMETLMGELLRSTQTDLVVVEPPAVPVVVCDPHMLRQVLMNLVLNAQQAMGQGGRITIHVGVDEGFGRLSVSDTGPGIPPEMRDRLFKPFQTSKKEGSGIGLALVKRFADNFNGSVTVASEPGKGATFYLKLPLANQVAPPPLPASDATPAEAAPPAVASKQE